jgi:hypothetical protein
MYDCTSFLVWVWDRERSSLNFLIGLFNKSETHLNSVSESESEMHASWSLDLGLGEGWLRTKKYISLYLYITFAIKSHIV